MKKNFITFYFDNFFQRNNYSKSGSNLYKLVIPKPKTKAHKIFFTSACVRHWNRLKSSEINVRTCRLFKSKILNYFDREKIW